MQEDKVYRVKMARTAPSWLAWAGYGVVVAMVFSILNMGVIFMAYVLGGFTLVLVYLVHLIYNDYAYYFNMRQIKDLGVPPEVEEVINEIIGTSRYNDGLTKGEGKNEDQDAE